MLAPGSNAYHYDHIHVDLMRRASGRACRPTRSPAKSRRRAVQKNKYAHRDPDVTGSIGKPPADAIAGEDGESDDE